MAAVFHLSPPSPSRPRWQEKRPTLWKKSAVLVMFLTCRCGRSAPMIGPHYGAHFPYWGGMCGGCLRCSVRFESSSHNAGVPRFTNNETGRPAALTESQKNALARTLTFVLFPISLSENVKYMSVHMCQAECNIFGCSRWANNLTDSLSRILKDPQSC